METSELLRKLQDIDSRLYYDMGKYHQFTIDTVDDIMDELGGYIQGLEPCLTIEDLIGSFKYKIKNIMGICDSRLLDYTIFEEILDLLENS